MKLIQPAIALALTLLMVACSSPSFEDEPSTEFADEGLYPVRSTGFDQVYARRDAGLPDYQTVNIRPIDLDDVHFTTSNVPGTVGRDWQITPERERVLSKSWGESMDRAFSDYARAEQGEKVLRISAEMTRVRPRARSATAPAPAGVPTGVRGDLAEITIEIRLYDQASGDLLSVIRDSRDVPVIQWTQSNGMNMVNLFGSWSALLQARVSGR